MEPLPKAQNVRSSFVCDRYTQHVQHTILVNLARTDAGLFVVTGTQHFHNTSPLLPGIRSSVVSVLHWCHNKCLLELQSVGLKC
jgi:hypothetical protein